MLGQRHGFPTIARWTWPLLAMVPTCAADPDAPPREGEGEEGEGGDGESESEAESEGGIECGEPCTQTETLEESCGCICDHYARCCEPGVDARGCPAACREDFDAFNLCTADCVKAEDVCACAARSCW